MYAFLLVLLVLDGIFLGVVILLQSGKGGGLAAMGGGAASSMTEGVLGGRQATTLLTRATWAAGTIFMVLSLVLSIMSSRATQPASVIQEGLQQQPQQGAPAPEPVLPNVQQEGPGGGTPPPAEESGGGIP